MSDWGVTYLRHVLTEKGWTGAELAKRAGVQPSTINRPMNSRDYGFALSPRTLEKVAKATGIDYRPFMPQDGFSEAAPRVQPRKASPAIRMSIDGAAAHIEADVTLATLPELRRKIDLIEALLKG